MKENLNIYYQLEYAHIFSCMLTAEVNIWLTKYHPWRTSVKHHGTV